MPQVKTTVKNVKPIETAKIDTIKKIATAGSPGPLRSLEPLGINLHTSHAVRLVQGRRKSEGVQGIVGLIHFGQLVQFICDSAKADNPYADWWLIQITEKISDVKSELVSHRATIEKRMQSREDIDVSVGRSSAPVRFPLMYREASPYVFAASELVTQFDWLVCATELCKRVALLPPKDAYGLIDACSHRIRSVFTFASQWRNESITRDDVRQGTQPAQRAKQRMGDLPQDVLAGSWRDEWAPVIGTKRRAGSVLPPTSQASSSIFASDKVATTVAGMEVLRERQSAALGAAAVTTASTKSIQP